MMKTFLLVNQAAFVPIDESIHLVRVAVLNEAAVGVSSHAQCGTRHERRWLCAYTRSDR